MLGWQPNILVILSHAQAQRTQAHVSGQVCCCRFKEIMKEFIIADEIRKHYFFCGLVCVCHKFKSGVTSDPCMVPDHYGFLM